MTSYGRASAPLDDRHLVVEIKTLNSKFIDLRIKMPSTLNGHEIWLRKQIQERLSRGKVETTVAFENELGTDTYKINRARFKSYYKQLKGLTDEMAIDAPDLLGSIVRMPELVSSDEAALTEEERTTFEAVVDEALEQVLKHRREEGNSIEQALRSYVGSISEHLVKVDPFERQRVSAIRSRMSRNLQEYMKKENVDENRFEQEVMFYLEKIDISEEKVRLRQHCDYFLEVLGDQTEQKGRKLNFIGQEMGREINTLGAKAYSTDLQKLVVLMKDDLEKIKEQLANVL
ncbi:MAG: YicC family protein [Saprospiraceae bacterium]|nr:YicC family protein [Saprospiraceae bacterium]